MQQEHRQGMYSTMQQSCSYSLLGTGSCLEQKVNSSYGRGCSLPRSMSSYSGPGTMHSSIDYSLAENHALSELPRMIYSSETLSRAILGESGITPYNSGNCSDSINYNPKDYDIGRSSASSEELIFNPEAFIDSNAPLTQFVGSASEIQGLVEEAFKLTTGMLFPNDIMIRICSKEELKRMKLWQPGLNGCCINRKGFSFSNIFVLEGSLDRVMLTIGHEIGHCLSLPLRNKVDEEAKAFAFSLAWASTIRKNNIGDLAMNIMPEPAKNGLHNIAFEFVMNMIKSGKDVLELYAEIAKKLVRFSDT